MKFKIFSDLHLEFYNTSDVRKIKRILENYFPAEENDKETILLLAGDIGTYKQWDLTYKIAFEIFSKQFKQVFAIPGNHSWYKSDIWGQENEFLKDKKLPKNVIYGDDFSYQIDKDTIIIGCCLWTDMNKENPLFMNYAQGAMNDYVYIKKPYETNDMSVYQTYHKKTIIAQDTFDRHIKSKQFIIDKLNYACEQGIKNKIILSHHAPSFQSVDNQFRGDALNPAYCSDLESIMVDYNVTLWCHGHQHTSNDYMIENTRVIINSFGYHGYEVNPKFNPNLIIELN